MRTRLIRPGFFLNEDLAALSPHARLLFAGLWLIADRAGRLRDQPAVIRASVFPYEVVDADALLDELARAGFVVRYIGGSDRKCVEVVNFTWHQHPHHREPPSKLPPPPKSGRKIAKPRQSPDAALPKPLRNPSDTDTYSDTDTETGAAAPVRLPPFKVYAAIAARVLAETADLELDAGTLAEELKRACARQQLPYHATVIQKALDAARVARLRRRA